MLQASVIIPVWNGADVIERCLAALFAQPDPVLREVVCVDNASTDDSAGLIASHFSRVRLLRQPVNLGFAGGCNAGIREAKGDFYVLLNQDCLAEPGWLAALADAFAAQPEIGVAGCTILTEDRSLNHTGAYIHHPDAEGVHLLEEFSEPHAVEYVTGAAFGIRRQAAESIGLLDEGYYPAYYEESDYCYRARSHGFAVVHVPAARLVHLFTGQDWKLDPVKYAANHHRSRYRFVAKHFSGKELADFIASECAKIEAEPWVDQCIARLVAARDTLRTLPDIGQRKRQDCGHDLPVADRRQIEVGLAEVMRLALARAEIVGAYRPIKPLVAGEENWQAVTAQMRAALGEANEPERWTLRPAEPSLPPSTRRVKIQRWLALHLLGLGPQEPPPIDFEQVRQLNERTRLLQGQIQDLYRLLEHERDAMNQRVALLEFLVDYDYR